MRPSVIKLMLFFFILLSSNIIILTSNKDNEVDLKTSALTPNQFYDSFKFFGPNGELLAQLFDILFNQSLTLDKHEILDGVYVFNASKNKNYSGTYYFGENDQEIHLLSWADANNDSINDFADPGPGVSYCVVSKIGSFNYSINIEAHVTLIVWDNDRSFVDAMKRILDFAILLHGQAPEEILISEQSKLISWLLKYLNSIFSGDELFIFNPIAFQKIEFTPLQGYDITKTWYNTGANGIIDNDDFMIDPSILVNWNATAGIVKDSRMQWLLTNMSGNPFTVQSYITISFDLIQLWLKNFEISVDAGVTNMENQDTSVFTGMSIESYLFRHNLKGGYLYRDDDLDASVVVDVEEKIIAEEKPDLVLSGKKVEVTDNIVLTVIGGIHTLPPEVEGEENVTWAVSFKDLQVTCLPIGIAIDSYQPAYKENLTFMDFKLTFINSAGEPNTDGKVNAIGNVKLEHNLAPWNNGSGPKKDITGLDLAMMYLSSIFHFKFDVDAQNIDLVNQTQSDIIDEYDKTNNRLKIKNYLSRGDNYLDFVDITGDNYILGQKATLNGEPIGGTSYEANSAIELSGLWKLQGDSCELHTGDIDTIKDDFSPDFGYNISNNVMFYANCYSNFSDNNAPGIWHDPTFYIYMVFIRETTSFWPILFVIMGVGLAGIATIMIIIFKRRGVR
ncbi:MAG: hypothetical protein EAX89_06745 [Candidatus Lokiarchaeota archaeon]|nr:hypothetical protein [Candidatus Lokiarchaeota archaeon]